ncbi:hypothetical protein [Microcystis aeruginosa]|jgi:hypothetical protein|uniref:Uncharacterized protein n=1 Tax=Microcystis aeruginosa (strain NIES-843 / IAM M-2473) TaxID=449447 RepID=B0JVT2_MICAN|nr:hypothetical protein [Microcystis aeruginosa]BAG04675.1 unknown protein [Microcystis aeruginosa NIES-843]
MSYQLISELLAKYFHQIKQVLTQKSLIVLLLVWTPILFLQTGIMQYLDAQKLPLANSPEISTNYRGINPGLLPVPVDPVSERIRENLYLDNLDIEESSDKDENSLDWLIPVAIGAGAIALCLATGCLIP